MINIKTKLTGDLFGDLDRFELTVKSEILISGPAGMAKVIYDEARSNVHNTEKAHWFHGTSFAKFGTKYLIQPGTLQGAIYRVYSRERSDPSSAMYRISWNHKKAPYGFMVELGTSRAPAHPFMRPAFDHIREAIEAGKERMRARMATL